jgi:PIN domain nuclease of toxin-antitoxin system
MIVLDTHIWHWWINQIPGRLSPATIDLIEEADEVDRPFPASKWPGWWGTAELNST